MTPKPKKVCRWKYINTDDWDDDSYYETECRETMYFDDNLKLEDEDKFKWCPYCGKLIEVKREVSGKGGKKVC